MANLNLDLDYFESTVVNRLTGRLGKGSEVLLLRLWCYCGKHHAEDGRLTGYGPAAVESIAKWWGKSGDMITAMLAEGVLAKDGDTFYLPDWLETQGHISAFNARAKAMAKARWDAVRNAASNAHSNASALPAVQGICKQKKASAAERTIERLMKEHSDGQG